MKAIIVMPGKADSTAQGLQVTTFGLDEPPYLNSDLVEALGEGARCAEIAVVPGLSE